MVAKIKVKVNIKVRINSKMRKMTVKFKLKVNIKVATGVMRNVNLIGKKQEVRDLWASI